MLPKSRRGANVAVVLLALVAAAPAEAAHVSVGEGHRAPDFTLRDVEGRPVQLSRVLEGKVVLLNFWATWCPPCRVEMPSMERAYRAYRGRGLEILAVSVDSGPEAAAAQAVDRFMLELSLSFPALLDPEMKVAQQYRVLGIPATFLIDRRGTFRSVDVGPRDWFSPASRKKIEEALK
jgi:peroxiredoxin